MRKEGKEKGQLSIESIAVAGSLLVIVAMTYLYVSQTVDQSIQEQKIQAAILKIENASTDVLAAGPGNRRVVDIELPNRIETVEISGRTMTFTLSTAGGGTNDFYAILPVPIDGSIPAIGGGHEIVLETTADGSLLALTGLALTPSSVTETMQRNESKIITFTLHNFTDGSITGNYCWVDGIDLNAWTALQGVPASIASAVEQDFNAIITVPGNAVAGAHSGILYCTNAQNKTVSSDMAITVSVPPIQEETLFPEIARFCKDNCGTGPFYAAVWADSSTTADAVNVSGSGNGVNGRTHSNKGINISGSNNSFIGGTTYVSSLTNTGSFNVFNPAPKQVTTKAMPITFNLADYAPGGVEALAAQADGNRYHYVSGTFSVNNSGTVLDGLYYVTGTVQLNAYQISGTYTVVSASTIAITGSSGNSQAYASNHKLLYFSNSSSNSAIAIGGSSNIFSGAIYAPLGKADTTGSNNALINGTIIANRTRLAGSYTTISGTVQLYEDWTGIDVSKVTADDGSGNPCTNESGYGKWVVDANLESYVEFNFPSFSIAPTDINFTVNWVTGSTAFSGQYLKCYDAGTSSWINLGSWTNTASCSVENTKTIALNTQCYDTASERNNLLVRMGLNSSNTASGNVYVDYAKVTGMQAA